MTQVPETRVSGQSLWAGGAFIAMSRAVGQIAQVATFLVGARILGPADFGIFAMVSAAAVLMSVTAQAGWSGFILSARHSAQEVRQVLSLSTLFGLALSLAGITFAASGVLGADHAEVTALALWFSIWVLLATLAEGQFAVLLHREQVGAAAACQIAAEVTGFAVAVWSLLSGHGVLSLAWGRLAAQGVQLASMLAVSRTLPTLHLTAAVARRAVIFSTHVVGTRLLANVSQYIGTFAVGGFLGAEAAGLFRLGQRLVGAASELMNEPARVVTWLYLRRTMAPFDDRESPQAVKALQRAVERLVPGLMIIGAPLFVGLMLLSPQLLEALLGEV
ncbi:MAG: oligosaccharide flippase family protein, partial [Pararhodobacter sp.]